MGFFYSDVGLPGGYLDELLDNYVKALRKL